MGANNDKITARLAKPVWALSSYMMFLLAVRMQPPPPPPPDMLLGLVCSTLVVPGCMHPNHAESGSGLMD
uniref:Uncharacterized protein n=1 Tax=Leersia perrieri TaxID=77586 RepID=A0A0D9W256_9ORYZ